MPAGGRPGTLLKEDQRQILTASYIPFLLDALPLLDALLGPLETKKC